MREDILGKEENIFIVTSDTTTNHVSQWISTKERLPEKNKRVLVFGVLSEDVPEETDKKGIYTAIHVEVDGYWYEEPWLFQSHCCNTYVYYVTHWADLPDKPE